MRQLVRVAANETRALKHGLVSESGQRCYRYEVTLSFGLSRGNEKFAG